MNYLYKYRHIDIFTLEDLHNSELNLSNRKNFNDPFDAFIKIELPKMLVYNYFCKLG
jgi:hypothetical protein